MNQELFARLCAPFDPDNVRWRVGPTNGDKSSGIALAYIDARDAAERLDQVVGPGNWQDAYPWAAEGKMCCSVGIRVQGEWIWKSDGAGDTDMEGHKGAFSDAFKRACVKWGIARYLYDLPNVWMPIVQQGRSYGFSKETKQELTQRLKAWQERVCPTPPTVPDPGVTENDLIEAFKVAIFGDQKLAKDIWEGWSADFKERAWSNLNGEQREGLKEALAYE